MKFLGPVDDNITKIRKLVNQISSHLWPVEKDFSYFLQGTVVETP